MRTAPTSRRQNIRRKPTAAAKNDATGINESGPMYTGCVLLWVNGYSHIASRANRPGRLPPRYTCAALDTVDALD
jgi:hypothetical protein